MSSEARDVFVSYNRADRAWAEWIAWTLEEAGYSVVVQAWDSRPGQNFGLFMHHAARARQTVAVLSPSYLEAEYTQPEWAAAFVQDPKGAERILIPVRVAECRPDGMLRPIVYADLVGLGEEAARQTLLDAPAEAPELRQASEQLGRAVDGLREAGTEHELPRGLLARAAFRRLAGDPDGSAADLREAQEIAERGSMRLHEADAHLEWTRLHLDLGHREAARHHLHRARDLVRACGYGRREREVAWLESRLPEGS